MYIIAIPNIIHNSINIKSDEFNININKSDAIFINNYYLYKVNKNLTSGVSYQIESNNILLTPNLIRDNYNCILMYNNNYYDTGIAKFYHETDNYIIMNINNKSIDIFI